MIEINALVQSFDALAHKARLEVFRLLVQSGPAGLAAGELASRLGIAANALSFHLARLRNASLVHSRREGKQIFYSADYGKVEALLEFLQQNCCRDSIQTCSAKCVGGQESSGLSRIEESA